MRSISSAYALVGRMFSFRISLNISSTDSSDLSPKACHARSAYLLWGYRNGELKSVP